MRFLFEIVLAVFAVAGAAWMVTASFRTAPTSRVRILLRYLLPLFAWVPEWFFTHLWWHLIHPVHSSYPSWFWLLFWLGIIATALSFLPRVRLLAVARLIGIALAIGALFYVDWFAPSGVNTPGTLAGWLFLFAVILGIVALAVFIVWLFKHAVKFLLGVAIGIALIGAVCAIIGGIITNEDSHNRSNEAAPGPTQTLQPTTPAPATPASESPSMSPSPSPTPTHMKRTRHSGGTGSNPTHHATHPANGGGGSTTVIIRHPKPAPTTSSPKPQPKPSPKPTVTQVAPVFVYKTDLNDVTVGENSPNYNFTVLLQQPHQGTVTFSSSNGGKFSQTKFTVGGRSQVDVTYYAPPTVPASGSDTITVTIRDAVNGKTAVYKDVVSITAPPVRP